MFKTFIPKRFQLKLQSQCCLSVNVNLNISKHESLSGCVDSLTLLYLHLTAPQHLQSCLINRNHLSLKLHNLARRIYKLVTHTHKVMQHACCVKVPPPGWEGHLLKPEEKASSVR